MKKAIQYAETTGIVVLVCLPVHYFASVDWPWAVVIGAGVVTAIRAINGRRHIGGPHHS